MAVDRERRHQKHRQMIMAKYEGICHICEKPYADAIDHVVPVAKGGSDHPDNLRPAHTTCNSKKGARSYPEWAEENPNMWIPGHEPEVIREMRRRQAEAERQREAERRAAYEREREEFNREMEVWEKNRAERAALLASEPKKPAPDVFNSTWLGVVSLVVAVVVAGGVLFQDGNWRVWESSDWGGLVLGAAFAGFITYWTVAVVLFAATSAVLFVLERTLLRGRLRRHREELAAWQVRMDEFYSRVPANTAKPVFRGSDPSIKPKPRTSKPYRRSTGYRRYRRYRRY